MCTTTRTAGRSCARRCAPYQHVRSIGEDVSAGELLLPEGHRLRAADLAAAVAAGATRLFVRKRPLVLILPTGDEVRPIGTSRVPGEILDTNSLMLAEQAREAGCEARSCRSSRTTRQRIAAAVKAAAAECDLLIVIAGSSAGRDDYTARVVSSTGDARGARGRRPPRAPGGARRRRAARRCSARPATRCPPR